MADAYQRITALATKDVSLDAASKGDGSDMGDAKADGSPGDPAFVPVSGKVRPTVDVNSSELTQLGRQDLW